MNTLNDYVIKSGSFSTVLRQVTYAQAEIHAKQAYPGRKFEILLITPWGSI